MWWLTRRSSEGLLVSTQKADVEPVRVAGRQGACRRAWARGAGSWRARTSRAPRGRPNLQG
eukprot:1416804-Alexandrium_andersonii.AAC.1